VGRKLCRRTNMARRGKAAAGLLSWTVLVIIVAVVVSSEFAAVEAKAAVKSSSKENKGRNQSPYCSV
jgi:hypothetical protein